MDGSHLDRVRVCDVRAWLAGPDLEKDVCVMKLLVTGACGRLGQAVARVAQRQGVGVVGVDVRGWPEQTPRPEGLALHVANLDEPGVLDRLLPGCDGVIHTAGLHGADLERAGLEAFLRVNVSAVAGLLDKAREHGVRGVTLSSTMEVLIGRTGMASGLTVLDESFAVRCDSAYSISKYLMEELGKRYATTWGLSVASLRYMAFGYRSEGMGGPSMLGRVVHSEDVARAAILAATTPGMMGEVFNIGPESPITLEDIPEVMADPEGVVERYFPGSIAVMRRLNMTVTPENLLPMTRIEKARSRLGWSPEKTFGKWLEQQRAGVKSV